MSRPISIVTELYEPNLGGQETRFARFAEALAARGRKVTVYTSDHTGGSLPTETVSKGVHVVRHVVLRDYVRNGGRRLAPLVRYWRATRRLLRELTGTSGTVWINQMPVVHLLGTPDSRGLVLDWCEYPTYWMVNRFARRLAGRFRKGTAVSQAVADHVRGVSPGASIDVIRTPVPAPAGPAPDRQVGTIVYVGRIVAHKNLGALAEAIRQFNRNGGPHARLLIAGDGPDRSSLEQKYGGNGQIQFLGVVDEAEKNRLLRSSWMVAVPGTREGLPNVAAEATVCGTPLLASGSPRNSCGEFIRTNDLGVVASGTGAADFLSALHSIDGPSWDRWAGHASQLRSLYDPDENTRKLEDVLDRWST